MDRGPFVDLITDSALIDYRETLLGLARPAIDLVRTDADSPPSSSRVGGCPDRPVDATWPEHRLGPYRFIAQINVGELPRPVAGLPDSGLLSLFYAHHPEAEFPWYEDGFGYAEFHVSIEALVPQAPPRDVHFGSRAGVRLVPTLDLPHDEHQLTNLPSAAELLKNYEELSDDYRRLRDSLHVSKDYLLGYPSHGTLAYDPTPGPEWISLANLASDDDLAWWWSDGDRLMLFIERFRLDRGDVSHLHADAG